MELGRYERAAGNAIPPITPKMPVFILSGIRKGMGVSTENSEEPGCFSRGSWQCLHFIAPGAPPMMAVQMTDWARIFRELETT